MPFTGAKGGCSSLCCDTPHSPFWCRKVPQILRRCSKGEKFEFANVRVVFHLLKRRHVILPGFKRNPSLDILWMDEILHHPGIPGMLIPRRNYQQTMLSTMVSTWCELDFVHAQHHLKLGFKMLPLGIHLVLKGIYHWTYFPIFPHRPKKNADARATARWAARCSARTSWERQRQQDVGEPCF